MIELTSPMISQVPLWQRRILEAAHHLAAERAQLFAVGAQVFDDPGDWKSNVDMFDRLRAEQVRHASLLGVPGDWIDAVDQDGAQGQRWDEARTLPVVDYPRAMQLERLSSLVHFMDDMVLVDAERGYRQSVAAANPTGGEVVEPDVLKERQFRANLGQRWLLATGYADIIGATTAERRQVWGEVTASRPARARLGRSVDESTIEETWRSFASGKAHDETRKLYDLLTPDLDSAPSAEAAAVFPTPHTLMATQRRNHAIAAQTGNTTITAAIDAALPAAVEPTWNAPDLGHAAPGTPPTHGLEP